MASSSPNQAKDNAPPDRDVGSPDLTADELLRGADSDETPALSVVLPTLNEEEGIVVCIEKIKHAIQELQMTAEIVVSDSSTDRTPVIARASGAIVVEPDKSGYGYAYKTGFEAARGDYIVMGDADATYDFEELTRLIEPVRSGEADIVLGSRFDGEIRPGSMPRLHRYVGNPLLTRFLNVLYDADVSDAHSGFRVLSREAIEKLDLESDGMEFASEMIMDASMKGLTIREVPITYNKRVGDATLDSFRDGWRHVRFMLLNAPDYLFTVPALLLGVFGVSLLGLSQFGWSVAGIQFGLSTAILGSFLTIVGYEIACLAVFSGLIGDPIRKPTNPVTSFVTDRFRLEHGATFGVFMFAGGVGLASVTRAGWFASGEVTGSALVSTVLILTVIVLGLQSVFNSFFYSILSRDRGGS